jgi:hypothetical protein
LQLCHPIAIDLYDLDVENVNIRGVIPLSISYNKSLVILSRMAIYNFNVLNVLYVYMYIDETIIKNKYILLCSRSLSEN